jgi:hypothetical protein
MGETDNLENPSWAHLRTRFCYLDSNLAVFAGSPWAVARPGPPQIRTCPIKAYGSSFRVTLHDGMARLVPGAEKFCFASSALRCRVVYMGSSYEALAMFPANGSLTKTSPSLSRVLRVSCPCVLGTMRCSDFLTPLTPHFVTFVWRYHGTVRLFASTRSNAPARTWGSSTRSPYPVLTVETAGSLRFLGNPAVPMPCSRTPAGPHSPGY